MLDHILNLLQVLANFSTVELMLAGAELISEVFYSGKRKVLWGIGFPFTSMWNCLGYRVPIIQTLTRCPQLPLQPFSPSVFWFVKLRYLEYLRTPAQFYDKCGQLGQVHIYVEKKQAKGWSWSNRSQNGVWVSGGVFYPISLFLGEMPESKMSEKVVDERRQRP